jgi:hypothetical protein
MKISNGLFDCFISIILINFIFFNIIDVQAAEKSKSSQKKESISEEKNNANYYVYYDRMDDDKIVSKGYDIKNKKYFINTEFNPNKVRESCLAYGLNSGISICLYGKVIVGERFQLGTYFYYKPQLISITNSGSHGKEIEILPYYVVTEDGLKLHPIAFVTKMNAISNKVYFMLDSNKDVIEWGIEVKGKKKKQPIEIPIELTKTRMF